MLHQYAYNRGAQYHIYLTQRSQRMAGYILLEGGAEFGGLMSEPDLPAIELAGGPDAPISIIPTAAAPHNNPQRAGPNALNWFKNLSPRQSQSLPLHANT